MSICLRYNRWEPGKISASFAGPAELDNAILRNRLVRCKDEPVSRGIETERVNPPVAQENLA
jgi:hypothetical protein